jgi:hypothetical protein
LVFPVFQIKSVAGLRQTKLRGLVKVDWVFIFAAAAYIPARLPKADRGGDMARDVEIGSDPRGGAADQLTPQAIGGRPDGDGEGAAGAGWHSGNGNRPSGTTLQWALRGANSRREYG